MKKYPLVSAEVIDKKTIGIFIYHNKSESTNLYLTNEEYKKLVKLLKKSK